MSWFTSDLSRIIGDIGIIASITFWGIGHWKEARVLRAQTLLEITKLHRELWMRFDERPELAGLFDKARDLVVRPLSVQEVRFANLLFLHIRGTYHAEKAGVYKRPQRLREDVRQVFSTPGPLAAWLEMQHLHDADFVAFIEHLRAD